MAQAPVEITGVWLRSVGDTLYVSVEMDGEWRTVITEGREGSMSHICESSGMRRAKPDPLNLMKEKDVPVPKCKHGIKLDTFCQKCKDECEGN